MATVLTPRMRFLHVPKTGGTWVTEALMAAGVPCQILAPPRRDHYSEHGHVSLEDAVPRSQLFDVAFVRHPLDWWRSFWAHRMREGWLFPDHEIDSRASSEDFDEFIAMVVERLPGFLEVLFSRFIGPAAQPIDFIGRYERLSDDLALALRLAGEPFDEAALRSYPPRNVGDYERWGRHYDPDLALALALAERRTIDRFYPHERIPEQLVDRPLPHRPPAAGTPDVGLNVEIARVRRLLGRAEERLHEQHLALDAARADAAASRQRADDAAAAARLAAAEISRLGSDAASARDELQRALRSLEQLRASRLLRATKSLRCSWYRRGRGRKGRLGLLGGKASRAPDVSRRLPARGP
jgi:hypothetical protein